MKTAIVKTSFWDEPEFDSLSIEGKFVYLYLLNNPDRGLYHVFSTNIKVMAVRISLSLEASQLGINQLVEKKMICNKNNWFKLLKGHVEAKKGRFTEQAIEREKNSIPLDILDFFGENPTDSSGIEPEHKDVVKDIYKHQQQDKLSTGESSGTLPVKHLDINKKEGGIFISENMDEMPSNYIFTPKKDRPSRGMDRDRRERLYKQLGNVCNYCGSVDAEFELDHIHPISLGGHDRKDNFQVLCIPCHKIKTNREQSWFRKLQDQNRETINQKSDNTTKIICTEQDVIVHMVEHVWGKTDQTKVMNPKAWKTKVAHTMRTENRQKIIELLRDYPYAPASLIGARVLGESAMLLERYRKDVGVPEAWNNLVETEALQLQ